MRSCVISLVILAVTSACNPGQSTPLATAPPTSVTITTNPTLGALSGLARVVNTDRLSVWAAEADRQVAQDVAQAIQSNSEKICAELRTACQFQVVVEIHPDQASFDRHVMNQDMRRYFALSGYPYTIQIVSPANPAPHKISYEDGVLIAVHEFVHLALDEINPALPAWLDEGTAVYLRPHEPYTTVCQFAFPFEMIPSFRQLAEAYGDLSAPDLFAYTAVDFIVHEYDMDKLNRLLRAPEDGEKILRVSSAVFEDRWHRFMHAHYHNRQTSP
jgi:hypothetical protein